MLLSVLPLALAACGKKIEKHTAGIPEFAEFRNVKDGPGFIRDAARAVINFQGSTGFFIASDGLVMTNAHVLGPRNCAQEGCFVNTTFNYEIGKAAESTVLYAKPVLVAAELDVAVFQLQEPARAGRPAKNIKSPDYLEFADVSAEALVGTDVYVIGHPAGAVKKYNRGRAFDFQGSWFRSDNMSLGGNSGSPFVNHEGQVVGILHHGRDDAGNIRKRGLNVVTLGTAAQAIAALVKGGDFHLAEGAGPGLELYNSNASDKPQDAEFITKNYLSYLNAGVAEVATKPAAAAGVVAVAPAEKALSSVVEIVGEACDKDFAETPLLTSEAFYKSYEKCSDAVQWLDCRQDREGERYVKVHCPNGDQQQVWRQRFAAITARARAFNSENHYYWFINAPTKFAENEADAEALSRKNLKAYLKAEKPELNFQLASYLMRYLADENGLRYDDQDVARYVAHYRDIANYEHSVPQILSAAGGLYMTRDERVTFLRGLLHDANLSLNDRLTVESICYRMGYFGWQG